MKICVLINKNNIVTSYGECLCEGYFPFDNGFIVETKLNLEEIEIVNNYKLIDGGLVELTEEEKKQWQEANKIDICPPKTLEERLEEAEQKLAESEEEKKLLKAQVEANASSYEFLESCIMEMAEKVYA